MASVDQGWTRAHDDALRDALTDTLAEADSAVLDRPSAVRAVGDRRRRGRTRGRALVAAVLVLVLGGLGYGLLRGGDAPDPSPATPGPTVSATASRTSLPGPSSSASPRRTPTTTDTDVIGEDGSVGPFRVGMTPAQVRATIRRDYPDGSVRIEQRRFVDGQVRVDALVQDGADSQITQQGAGSGIIGLIDSERRGTSGAGVLDVLLPPTTARLHGLGVGDPVAAFQREFPDRVAPDASSTVYRLTFENGTRLQLGMSSSYLDPSAGADTLVVLEPGRSEFSGFPYFTF
ncbi:hypothetical protein [Phycicoccus flavus]|uniref:Uncharacterized protein n=1 Tax=Phycicoccus flavus TaxID=2502783 RepID=A0A8T6R8K7_9MICO|nr:hypothetical protein [Phycicoccus flavus]NHA68531.1 hypothetical protein [Phycicoccus flavus]